MEFLNYVRPKDRLLVLQNAYERLKPLIQKGNAQVEIEEDLRTLS